VPRTFSVWVTKKGTTDWAVDRATGQRRRRAVECWDVGGRADGVQWLKRFRRAGLAQTWKEQLEADFCAGLRFDIAAKRFVTPEPPTGPAAPTVYDLTEAYFRQHPEWEPKTKMAAARSFNRARRFLFAPGAVIEGEDLLAVDDYLENASFLPDHLADHLSERQATGRAWLRAHSAPAGSLTAGQVDEFVARFALNQRDPSKRVSATTLTRLLQPLKACWSWAMAREDIPVDRNPWAAVRSRRKVKGKATMTGGGAALAVDADMVIGIEDAFALADACTTKGAWGGVVECFVLVMALCGLRPGEAAGLLWEDIELPAGDGAGWVTVRRTHRPVPARWLDPGEDPEWGPLKDRDLTDTRRVPVPPPLVSKFRHHLRLYGEGPGGLVFHRNEKAFDPDMFGRNVWEPTRSALWPLRGDLTPDDPRQPKLARLRRHDLRHAACSWWLREGVDAVVCQRWSGHRTLSVFLDIYQGVAPGREEDGVRKLVASCPCPPTAKVFSAPSPG
jgi:integrase